MSDALARLTAGLDQDKAAASLRVSYEPPATLRRTIALPDGQVILVDEDGKYAATALPDVAKFMEHNNPARILRQVEAIRRVMWCCDDALDLWKADRPQEVFVEILETLASVYAGEAHGRVET